MFFSIMPPEQSNRYIKHEIRITNTLKLLKNKEFFSLKAIICTFKISYFILHHRYNTNDLKYNSHKIQQNFINAEELTLI